MKITDPFEPEPWQIKPDKPLWFLGEPRGSPIVITAKIIYTLIALSAWVNLGIICWILIQ